MGVRDCPVLGRQAHGEEVLVCLESQPSHVPQSLGKECKITLPSSLSTTKSCCYELYSYLVEFEECPAGVLKVESLDS